MLPTCLYPLAQHKWGPGERLLRRSYHLEIVCCCMLAVKIVFFGRAGCLKPQSLHNWLVLYRGHVGLYTPCDMILQYDIDQIQCNTVYRAVQQILKQYSAVWSWKNIVYGILHYLLHWPHQPQVPALTLSFRLTRLLSHNMAPCARSLFF
jgi:hypothetical protein